MTDPIRLAIVGTGLIVTAKHWPALRALPEQFSVVALANRTRAKAEALASLIEADTGRRPRVFENSSDLLDDVRPEAVSLALPIQVAPGMVETALMAGAHVLTEKPIAPNLRAAATMLGWPKRYGRVLMIGENYRYVASWRKAAVMISEGSIGTPGIVRWFLHHYLATDNPYYRTEWRQQPEHDGGYITDAGVHHMAVLRMLLGEISEISGQVSSWRSDLPPFDSVSASLRFERGTLGSYANTFAAPGPSFPLQVIGDEATLLGWRDRLELWQEGRTRESWDLPSPADGLRAMYQDFALAVRGQKLPDSTPEQGYADLRVITALLRSARTGRAVRVDDME